MSSGNYTWEDVMLGIDYTAESTSKQEREAEIRQKQIDEQSAMGWWSLGLSVLGGALFGPAGYAAGKIIGRQGADWGWFEGIEQAVGWEGDYSDWEDMEIDVGKFDKKMAKKFNESIEREAKDQSGGQILNTLLDLGAMYVQSGGLTAKPGEWDPTTFGSGESEWSVFGRGEAGLPESQTSAMAGTDFMPTPSADIVPGVLQSADYVPSLWNRDVGITRNLLNVGTNLGQAYTQEQSIAYLTDQWRKIQQEKDEE